MFHVPLSANMCFSDAAAAFLAARTAPETPSRVQYIAPRTLSDYQQYLKTLGIFFAALKLSDIHMGHIAEYQRRRSVGDGFTRVIGNRKGAEPVASPAAALKINSEIGVLKKLMKMAGAWTPQLEAYYTPFQVEDTDIPRALSPDEQERFLGVAATNPDWQVVWWYSIVALHLTFSSDEMRTIRIGDVNLTHQLISVNRRYGKNRYRRREIPICDGACVWALERLIERAKELGGGAPQHFLLPFRVVKGTWDPERPMSPTGLRKPFEAVRKAAGVPWFRLNGWRHTAITRLAEAGVPIATIMQRSGHVTHKMSDHYTHISEQAHRLAIANASRRMPVVSIDAARLRQQMAG